MATLSDLFGGAGSKAGSVVGAAGANVQTAPPVSPTGAPPGDNRYGAGKPLTDQYAGKTLADMLRDLGNGVDIEAVTKSMKPEQGGKLWTAQVKQDRIFLQPKGAPQPGQQGMAPENLIVLASAEAQAILQGQGDQSLLGRQPRQQVRPAMPGVGGAGPRIGPPGLRV